ncbi:MAG TPA: AraC family transcriptional regulator [Lentisphaeria bacterium]|jgi:LacI family transcriptional regulator|nr:AraC family transcriptional regulator [Lentisphaeria bacterium]
MSYQIAIVMSEVFLRRLTPSLTPFVRRDVDYRIVSIHRPTEELHELIRDIAPDGLMTEWLPGKTDALLAMVRDIPTVIVDTDYSYPGALSVDVDDLAVGREAAHAFRQAGLRHMACLGNGQPYSEQRIQGFRQAADSDSAVTVHNERGFEDTRYSESFLRPSAALGQWLRDLPKPIGIFAVHDPLGRYLCGACQQLGLGVPDDVSVIGANNDELVCGLTHPKLSSVAIPWNAIGETAGACMQGLITGELRFPQKPRLVPPSGVVLRHSANHFSVDDPMLRRAMAYFSERLQEPINVSILCDDLRIARRSLERKFQDHYHCTPWEMLCQLRVNHAKRLLAETSHSVARVADLCGFNDPEQFAVVFKRLTKMPPSHYRRRLYANSVRSASSSQ